MPIGIEIAGTSARLAGAVNISERYMAMGPSFSPIKKADSVGKDGLISSSRKEMEKETGECTSPFERSSSNSSCLSPLFFREKRCL